MRRSLVVPLALAMLATVAWPASASDPSPPRIIDADLPTPRIVIPAATDAPDDAVIDGEVVIVYRKAVGASARREVRGRAPNARLLRSPGPRIDTISVPVGTEAAAIRRIERDPRVAGASRNMLAHASGAPVVNDPVFDDQWGLLNSAQFDYGTADADIDADVAWSTTTGDDGIIVAIVDSGVAMDHPDLDGQIWVNPLDPPTGGDDDGNGLVNDTNGWDFFNDDNDPTDDNGHGTHVAGIVGAEGNNATGVTGVARDVTIMPLKALNAGGSGGTDLIAAAFDYAGEHGAHIVNASLGVRDAMFPDEPLDIRAAIEGNPNTLFVVAAGNDGASADVEPQTWPCATDLPNLVCVASTDHGDDRSGFSNYGNTSVDLAAPGSDIWSTMIVGGAASLGSFAVTDSPDGTYENNLTGGGEVWLVRDAPVDLTGRSGCSLLFDLMIHTENGGTPATRDRLYALASSDGVSYDVLDGWAGSSGGDFIPFTPGDPFPAPPLTAYEGGAAHIAFLFDSNASVRHDGAYLDNINVDCSSGGDPMPSAGFESGTMAGWTTSDAPWDVTDGTYLPLSGTSMATPMVAGAAALLWSLKPGSATDAEWMPVVMGALQDGVETTDPWMTSELAWGGRLNVNDSIMSLDTDPPNSPTILSKDVGKNFQRGLTFSVRSSTTTDVGHAGIDHYDIQRRQAHYKGGFGAWGIAFEGQRTGTFAGKTGRTYCFRSRATDNAFNVGSWGAKRCTAIPVNDRELTASSGWVQKKPKGAFRNTAMRTTLKGKTLSLANVKVKRLGVVATRCGTCGKIAVFRGNKRLKIIDLSGSLKRNHFFAVKTWPGVLNPATIRIKVVSSGKQVLIEGLGVAHA